MKLVSLSLLVTGVLGAVSQYCAGFEDSKKPRQLTVKVGSDSSILMYHIADISSSNIPMIIDDQVLRLEPNGFGICTESKASQGRCDAVGTFMVKFDDLHHHLVNKFAYAGEKVNLTISKEGLYCVVTYQEGAEVSDVKVVERHSYGYLSLTLYETMKVFLARVALLIITLWALMYAFKSERRANIGTIYEDIAALLVVRWNQIGWKILALKIQKLWGTKQAKFVDLTGQIDMSYMVLTWTIYHDLSDDIFGFKKEEREKMTILPLARRIIFGAVFLSVPFFLQKWSPLQFSALIGFVSEAMSSIVWIWVFLLEDFKITQRKMLDPVFAKNYPRSRLCLLSVPIVVSVISFGCAMVVQSVIPNGSSSGSSDFSKYMKGKFAFVFETSMNQNYLFELLRRSEYWMLSLQWAFLFLWRPHLVNKAEFEKAHSNEVGEVDEVKFYSKGTTDISSADN